MNNKQNTKERDIDGILSFLQKFPNEQSCNDYLVDKLWEGKKPCPYCQSDSVYKILNGKKYRCSKCKMKFTVTTKTFFASSKVSLHKWFMAIFLLSTHKKGYSSIQLGKDLNISQKSAWNLGIKVRALLSLSQDISPLTGIVEMDEAYVGRKKRPEPGKKRKRGKGTTKVPLVGMVERGGRVIAMPAKANRETLTKIATQYIDSNADIMTDDSNLYNNFKDDFKSHESVCHSKREYARGNVNTNTIEGFWSQLKLGLLITHHSVSAHYIDLYCDEFAYRYSMRRLKKKDLFDRILQQIDAKRIRRIDLKNRQTKFFRED